MIEKKADSILKEIIAQTGLKREEVEEMVKSKIDELKGLISTEGALFIISKELKVVIEKQERSKQDLYAKRREEARKNAQIPKERLSLLVKDICFSESLEVYTVKLYMENSSNFAKPQRKVYECSCQEFLQDSYCRHICIYQDHFFDPWFIPDNSDAYSEYNDIWPEDISFKELVIEYPRWVIDFLLLRWQQKYPEGSLASEMHISNSKLEKLLVILREYRMQQGGDMEKNIKKRFLNPIDNNVWACELNLEKIPEFPNDEILKSIEFVDIGGNNLSNLPRSFRNLTSLKELIMNYNTFVSLPEWFSELRSLEILDLEGNLFREIPQVLYSMPNLKELNIKVNLIKEIPEEFKKKPGLLIHHHSIQ